MYDYKKTWIPSSFTATASIECIKAVKPYLKGKVLELGCGDGRCKVIKTGDYSQAIWRNK